MTWFIAQPHWCRGLATGTAHISLRFACGPPAVDQVLSGIDGDNISSIRVDEKIGTTCHIAPSPCTAKTRMSMPSLDPHIAAAVVLRGSPVPV